MVLIEQNHSCAQFLYPPQTKFEWGVFWNHHVRPSVCPSVRPSVRPYVRPVYSEKTARWIFMRLGPQFGYILNVCALDFGGDMTIFGLCMVDFRSIFYHLLSFSTTFYLPIKSENMQLETRFHILGQNTGTFDSLSYISRQLYHSCLSTWMIS